MRLPLHRLWRDRPLFTACLGWMGILLLGGNAFTRVAAETPPAHSLPSRPHASDVLFQGPVLKFDIQLAPADLESLRREPRKTTPATLRIGTNTWQSVGIRVKGAAGSTRGIDDGPALTFNADKFKPGQKIFGLDKFHLNNSVQDPSRLSEIVCSDLYRRAGIPTTRAANALVSLNGRLLGLYVLKEGFDKGFLSRNFPDATGNLYDGGFLRDVDQDLELDSGKQPADWNDLHALTAACRIPDPAQRRARVATLVDVDRFITYTALQILTEDWDGYPSNRNNYRLYHEPSSNRFVFMPHGMDQMFSQIGMPLDRGFEGLVAQTILGDPEWRRAYFDRAASLCTDVFTAQKIFRTLDDYAARREPALGQLSPGDAAGIRDSGRRLREQIAARLDNVRQQLANRPKPSKPLPDGVIDPRAWRPVTGEAGGTARLVEAPNRTAKLELGAPGSPSWRARISLPAGRYRFDARARSRDVVSAGDRRGTGLGIRISGTDRTHRIEGTSDWKPLTFEFTLSSEAEVDLVAELRAEKGSGWFDTGAFRIQRLP